jgi:flagellar basal-body rod modification protein FlgD
MITSPSAVTETRPATSAGLPSNQVVSQQEFLTLFIEQLKRQDPLSPLQPEQLTAQLAQFSSLEQLTGINSRLDALAATTRGTTSSALLGLIGREVRIEGGAIELRGGAAPEVVYRLDAAADRVTATVRASNGAVVRQVELGAQPTGEHTFVFDGQTTLGGAVADGRYTVEVTATSVGNPEPTPLEVLTIATVDGVDLAADPPAILAGGRRLGLEDVREVRAGASPAA